MHDDNHKLLMGEIRYAERLTQRTARLYRRAATLFTFLTVIGGSAVASALSAQVPNWVTLAGMALMGLVGATALAMRPLEKAILNESEARKYAQLRTAGLAMSTADLAAAVAKAHEGAAPEIEALRAVAYNDMVTEIGRADQLIVLGVQQRMFAALA